MQVVSGREQTEAILGYFTTITVQVFGWKEMVLKAEVCTSVQQTCTAQVFGWSLLVLKADLCPLSFHVSYLRHTCIYIGPHTSKIVVNTGHPQTSARLFHQPHSIFINWMITKEEMVHLLFINYYLFTAFVSDQHVTNLVQLFVSQSDTLGYFKIPFRCLLEHTKESTRKLFTMNFLYMLLH